MRKTFAMMFVCVAGAQLGCSYDVDSATEAESANGVTETALTGGRLAQPSEYRSTVLIGGCTGTKVGSHLILTAAHCVYDLTTRATDPTFAPGQQFWFTSGLSESDGLRQLTVVSTSVHPSWPESGQPPIIHPADVAVVEVLEDTPEVPEAAVDATPAAVGDPVVITGFGCDKLNPSGGGLFKLSASTVLSSEVLLDFAYSAAEAADVNGSFAITPGLSRDPSSASTCPGDSGGPLYRQSATDLIVVGVNSYTTAEAIPELNFHTRLGSGTTYQVLDWLTGLGVNVRALPEDVTPPTAPTNLTWSHVGMTVTLSWQASTDNVGVTGYDLYYGSSYLGSFTETTMTSIGLKAGVPYTFSVKAHDAAGNVSEASNQVTVLLPIDQDTTAPTAPTNLTVTSVTSTSIGLNWTASTDDVGVVVYQVLVNGSVAVTVTVPRATISGLAPNTRYTITTEALDAAGNRSPASAPLTVTTSP